MAAISKNLKGSCLVVDHGRTHEERAIIAVENGHYRGFGFLDEGMPLTSLYEAIDHITVFRETPESMKIIHSYLATKNVERVLRW